MPKHVVALLMFPFPVSVRSDLAFDSAPEFNHVIVEFSQTVNPI